jgi:hypothetical protein
MRTDRIILKWFSNEHDGTSELELSVSEQRRTAHFLNMVINVGFHEMWGVPQLT